LEVSGRTYSEKEKFASLDAFYLKRGGVRMSFTMKIDKKREGGAGNTHKNP